MKSSVHWAICLLLCCTFLIAPSFHCAQAADPIRVTFVIPTPPFDAPFWQDYALFMDTAARSLGIELTIVVANGRFEVTDNVKQILSEPDKPDYLIHIYQAVNSITNLEMANEAGVKSVIVNTGIIANERGLVGSPRTKFPLWIGHIYPDDTEAGRQLMNRLIIDAKRKGLHGNDKQIRAIGIGGNLTATSSLYREAGLHESLRAHSDVTLERFVLAGWDREKAHRKAEKLLEIYPETHVVWAINDHTAMGILDAMKEKGAKAGTDVLIGGIDWSSEGLKAVQDGRMEATIGGHFMEGAWALIMILDFHNGRDFAAPNPTLKSQMRVIDANNIDTYRPALDRSNWEKINFKQFTKTFNPQLREYNFSPDAIVTQLAGQ